MSPVGHVIDTLRESTGSLLATHFTRNIIFWPFIYLDQTTVQTRYQVFSSGYDTVYEDRYGCSASARCIRYVHSQSI